MSTEILTLDEVTSSQASKETTVNTALRQLEAQLVRVLSRTTTAQPGSPAAGDVYLLGGSPTGANWSTQANKLAHYFGGAWAFYTVKEGMSLWVNDEDVRIRYNGSAWDIIDALPRMPVLSKSANYTVLTTDRGRVIFVDTSAGSVTLTLPAVASAGDGFVIAAIKTSASNSLIFDGNASETINGSTTLTLTDNNDSRILVSNGTVWRTVGGGGSGGGGVTLPISDATALLKNDSDATKTIRISAASVSAGTERVYTGPNKNGTFAMLDDVAPGGNGSDQLAEDSANHNGLLYAYKAGIVRLDNVLTVVPAGTVLVTEGATNYVEVNSAGTVSSNTTSFTSGRFPMATVTTVAGSPSAIDVVTDRRSWALCAPAVGAGTYIGFAQTTTTTATSTTSQIPSDNTIPQSTEGAAFAALDTAYTPQYSTSIIKVEVSLLVTSSGGQECNIALFKDADTSASAATIACGVTADNNFENLHWVWTEVAGSTSARTYKIRFGRSGSSGTVYLNQKVGAGTFSTTQIARMMITEIKQ